MRKIIGLVGETGAGKDTFADYVAEKNKNVFVFRFSQPLTEALKIFLKEIKKEDQQWLATCLRERFGKDILAQAIKKRIESIREGIIILNGVRMWEEYEMIRSLKGRMIYITASPKIRWQRLQTRKEKKDDKISYKKFLKLEKAETEILISKIGRKADFKIENNKTRKEFYQKIDQTLKKLDSNCAKPIKSEILNPKS